MNDLKGLQLKILTCLWCCFFCSEGFSCSLIDFKSVYTGSRSRFFSHDADWHLSHLLALTNFATSNEHRIISSFVIQPKVEHPSRQIYFFFAMPPLTRLESNELGLQKPLSLRNFFPRRILRSISRSIEGKQSDFINAATKAVAEKQKITRIAGGNSHIFFFFIDENDVPEVTPLIGFKESNNETLVDTLFEKGVLSPYHHNIFLDRQPLEILERLSEFELSDDVFSLPN